MCIHTQKSPLHPYTEQSDSDPFPILIKLKKDPES